MVLKRACLLSLFVLKIVAMLSQSFDTELLLHETEIILRGNSLIKKTKVEIQVNNLGGEKFTKVKIPYSKSNRLKNLDAYVTQINGKIVKKLKKKDVVDRNAYSQITFYDDNFVKEFTLRHNIYPYILVYSYEEQCDEFLYVDFWQPLLAPSVPTVNAKLKIDIPKDYQISVKEHLVEKHHKDSNGERDIYTWTMSYNGLIEPEIYASMLNELLPYVAIVPKVVNYGVPGDFSNWVSFGNWQSMLNDGLGELTTDEKKKINTLVSGIDDIKSKIKVLYSYLQKNTRYINVSMGIGGLKPHPASYVCRNKYGDCKALANYFKAVLAHIGVRSFYTKILAGKNIRPVDKNFVAQQFNHIILFVPLEKDTIWLDCTSDGPFNYLGTFNQGRSAFIIERDNSRFINTPALRKDDVLESRNVVVKYSEDEEAVAQFNIIYGGRKFEELDWITTSVSASEKEEIIRERYINGDFQLDNYKLENVQGNSASINLKYDAKSNLIYRKYGNDLLIKILGMQIPEFPIKEERKLPVKIDYPIYYVDSISYELPVGYLAGNIAQRDTVISKYGEYCIDFKQENGILKVEKSFYLKKGDYLIEEYAEFYGFIETVREKENRTLILTRKE